MLSCVVHYHHTSAVLFLTNLILKSFPLQLIQIMVLSEQAGQGVGGGGKGGGGDWHESENLHHGVSVTHLAFLSESARAVASWRETISHLTVSIHYNTTDSHR